jgi:hypothetical protein
MNTLQEFADQIGLKVTYTFVPFSKSRNSKDKVPSLNWKVSLFLKDKCVLTADYSAGQGHCPSYSQNRTIYVDEAVRFECEKGHQHLGSNLKGKPILPKMEDVLSSLILDAEVLNYSTFEEWADNMGYNPDSRKHETIYIACLKMGLKLRNGLGDEIIKQLQELLQDY